MAKAYTLGTYRVIPGREAEFILAWKQLATILSALPNPPFWGTLIKSTTEPTLFHSFGPWTSPDDVAEMRSNPLATAAFEALAALCRQMTSGDYELITHVQVR